MALSDDINNLPTTVGDGQTGHLQNHAIIHAATKDHEERLASVEGRIPSNAALDLVNAGTFGAYIMAGTRLIFGDSGWHTITGALSVAPNSGSIAIRRTANTLIIACNYLQYSNGVSAKISLPPGWRPLTQQSGQLGSSSGAQAATYRINTTELEITWTSNFSAHTSIFCSAETPAWPTTLPSQP